jgi:hypothetical protein
MDSEAGRVELLGVEQHPGMQTCRFHAQRILVRDESMPPGSWRCPTCLPQTISLTPIERALRGAEIAIIESNSANADEKAGARAAISTVREMLREAEREAGTPDNGLREALERVGRKLMSIEDTVLIAREAQQIVLSALQHNNGERNDG